MAFCGKCGTQLSDGAKFCPKCGQPTSEAGDVQNYVVNNSHAEESHEEQIKTWQKIVSVLVWPAGVILIIGSLIKKQSAVAKSALLYTLIGLALSVALQFGLGGCSGTTVDLENEVKTMMIDTMKEKGQNLSISQLTLVHQEGNNYTGIAKCILDGEKIDLDVDVVFDGEKFQAEWAPTAEYQQKVLEEGLNELFDFE